MTKYYYHDWTPDEDKQLTHIMINGRRERKKVLALFKEAAKKLQRTAKSCENRWYAIREEQTAV